MTQGTGRGQVYEGPASEMRDSDWLSSEDLQGILMSKGTSHIDVTIASVLEHHNVKFEAGRTERRKFSLAFEGASKQLLLNSTNQKRLVALFGGHTKDWKGKRIQLHLEEDKLPKGGRGPCTRIVKTQQQQAPPPQPEPQPEPQQPPQPPPPQPPQQDQQPLDGMPASDDWTQGLD